jgi:acyl-coenzyme A synthetase/AMP-(fatty) acid ligase
LTERGIGKGDRVILLIPMQIELYVCMSAIMNRGGNCFCGPSYASRPF